MRRDSRYPFHLLAKPTGAVCNLDCTYCFFLSKKALYPDGPSRMTDEMAERYVRQVLAAHTGPVVTVAWQGGEPTLMGLEFFRRAVALVERYRRPGQQVEHTIQTNGTLLTPAWCTFFAEHGILVGLSIDGPRQMHDAYRVDKGGHPTFDKVMRAAALLKQHGVEFNILCTVHAQNAEHPLPLYRFFRDELGARYLQLIPIVERTTPELAQFANRGWGSRAQRRPLYVQEGNGVTERSVRPEQWGRFLIAIFDEWVRRDVGQMYVQLFDSALGAWLGIGASMCVFQETCGNALALEYNGDLYACDHYVEPRYLLGNIGDTPLRELVDSPRQRAFGAAKRDALPHDCRACDVRFACNGECPRNRFLTTAGGEPGLNYLCAGYKAFFHHIDRPMRLMAGLLHAGRFADEVMTMLERDATAGKPAKESPS